MSAVIFGVRYGHGRWGYSGARPEVVYTLIDALDLNFIRSRRWAFNGSYFAHAHAHGCLTLQRFLLDPPDSDVVDHINEDKFDNRRVNLRVVSQSENISSWHNRRMANIPHPGPAQLLKFRTPEKLIAQYQLAGAPIVQQAEWRRA